MFVTDKRRDYLYLVLIAVANVAMLYFATN